MHLAKLQNAWQEMWANAANRDVINIFIDFATLLLNIIDKVGLLGSAFTLVWGGSILKGLATADSWLVKFIQGLNNAKESSQSLGEALKTAFSTGDNGGDSRLKGLAQIRKDKENRTKPTTSETSPVPEVVQGASEVTTDMTEASAKNIKAEASKNATQANMQEMASEEALKTAQQENTVAETEETVAKTEGASASQRAVQENIKEAESIKLTTEAIKEKAATEALQYQDENPQKYKGRKKRRMPQHDQKMVEAELIEYYQNIADTADEAAEASMDWTLAYVGGFDKIESSAEKTTGVFSKISTGFGSMLGSMSSGLSSLGSSLSSVFVTLATNPMTWLVGIPAAIGIATTAINYFAQSQQRLVDGAKEATTEWNQFESTLTNYEQQYTDLAKQLENQNLSEAETLNIKEQIFNLQKQITDEYGKSADGINLVNGSLDDQLEKLRQLRVESQAENYTHNAKEYNNSIEKMETPRSYNQMTLTRSKDDEDYVKQLKDAVKDTAFVIESTEDGLSFKLHENAEASEEDLNVLQEALTKVQKQMGADWDGSMFEEFNSEVSETIKTNDAFLAKYKESRDTGLEGKFFDLADADDISMYFDYQQGQSDYNQALLSGDDEKIAETQEAWRKLQAQKDEYLNAPDSNNAQFKPLFDQYDKEINESFERAYEVRKQMESDENRTLVEQAFGDYKENRKASKENQKALLEAAEGLLNIQHQAVDWGTLIDPLSGGAPNIDTGNLNMDTRPVIKWTEDLKKQYAQALSDWNMSDIMPGDISTVMGASKEFGGVEIAYTPILDKGNGKGELLTKQAVYDYLTNVVEKATDKKTGEVKLDDILKIDATKNGGKGLIASVGKAGDLAVQRMGASLHFMGKNGAIAIEMERVAKAAKDAGMPISQVINLLQTTGGTSALQQALEGTRVTAEEMKTAFLEGDEAITGLASQFGIDFNSPDAEIDNFINKMAAMSGAIGDTTSQGKSSLDRFYEDTSAKIEELSSLTATLQKGQAQTGLTFTKTQDEQGNDIASEVKTIVGAYKDLEGFDLGSLFEETATGVKLNYDAYRALAAEEEAEVKRQYKLERAALANQLATATGDRKAEIQKQITELDMLSSAYDGATSALQKYLNQQNASDYGDTYAMLRDTTIKRADELMGKGMVGTEEFRSIAQLFSFDSLATADADKVVDSYLAGYEKVKKFFTEDNFTGMQTFADELTTLDEKFGSFTKETVNGKDIYTFEASDDQLALLAEHYGVSVDLIESLFDQLRGMGFNLHLYRDGGFEDFEKLDKQIEDSQNALKELKDAANDPQLIPDDLFNFNAKDLNTPEELKQKIEDLQNIQLKLPADSTEYKEAQKIIDALETKVKELEKHDEYSPKITVEDYDVGFEALDNINNELERMQQLNASGAGETKLTVQDNASASLEQNADIIAKLPSEVQTTIGMLWATDDPNQIMMQIALINGEEVEIPLSVQQSEAYQQFLEKTNPDQITRVQVQPEVEESEELNKISEDKEVTVDVKEGKNEVQEAVEETDGKEIVEKIRYENSNTIQDAANAAGAGQGVSVQTHSEETKNVTVTTDDSQLTATNNMVDQLTGKSGTTVSIGLSVSGTENIETAKTNVDELVKKDKSHVTVSINGNSAMFNKVYSQTNTALNTLAQKKTEPKITANNSSLKEKVSDSKEKLNSIKDKPVKITASQSGFSTISSWKNSVYDNLRNKDIYIRTHYSSTGSQPKTSFQGSAHNQGTIISKGHAYASGTLSGDWGIPKAEKGALVNELGSEVIVTPDGHWQILNGGDPTFANLPKGSIIFNHKQSESLLKKGYINGSYGKMVGGAFASGSVDDEDFDEEKFEGNAYAIGTTGWNGQLLGMSHAGSASGSFGAAKKAQSKSSSGSSKKSSSSSKKSSGKSGKSSGNSSSNKKAKDNLQTLDAIEIRLNRIDALISQLDANAGKTYETFASRNSSLTQDLATVQKEIDAINSSLKATGSSYNYLAKASAAAKEAGLKSGDEGYKKGSAGASGVALSQLWINRIQNSVNSGKYFTINDVKDEGLWKKIQAYQTWYEKYVKLQQKVQDQTAKLSQLTIQQLSLIQTKWETSLNSIAASITNYQNQIDLANEKGYDASVSHYNAQISLNKERVQALTQEASELQIKLNEAVRAGRIKEYSEEWYKWHIQIKNINNEIIATNKEIQSLNNAIRQLKWDKFDRGQDELSNLIDEAEFLAGLINEIDLFDKDTGIVTSKGKAAFGLEAQKYDLYIKQAQKYGEAVKELNKAIAKDPNNKTLIEQRNTWLKAQQDAIANAHSEKEAIADLVEKGIKKQIEAMEELIDKYEDALDAEKDQQKYADSIAEKQKKINSLQKQLNSMTGDDSEEGASRRQKLRDELKEAQKDLQETQEDQRLSEIKDALSDMREKYEEVLNARLDNIDALLEEVVRGVNQSGANICNTIKNVASSVNYNITDVLNKIYSGVQNLSAGNADRNGQSGALVSGTSTTNGGLNNTSATTLSKSTNPVVPITSTSSSSSPTATTTTASTQTKSNTASAPTTTSSAKNGLIKENGQTYFYKNNQKQTGWQTVNGKKHYFSVNGGAMLTGVQKIGNAYYLLDKNTGKLKDKYTGLYGQNNAHYYFKNGQIQTGWKDMNEGRRYFSVNTGKMFTGLQKIGNYTYYFNSKGILQKGTFTVGDYIYETDKDGKIKKKTQRTGGVTALKTGISKSTGTVSTGNKVTGTGIKKYASGTKRVPKSDLYQVDEEGNEVFINKQGKIYTRLEKGTTVLPHDAAVNLLKGMTNPAEFIANHMDMRPNKNITNTNNTTGDTVNYITFKMDGVTNYAEFMREAQRDPNFTKYIQEISIGKLNGNNSLKGNSIRFR